MRLAAFAAALLLLSAPASARTALEALSAGLASDPGLTAAERGALDEALSIRFADYGLQNVTPQREDAIKVALRMVVEGSFDEASPDRIAEVAFAAYQAIGRGAPPEVVEGIGLYGYRKKVDGETIAAWANGYQDAVRGGVPPEVAADLVRNAFERGWETSTFTTLKWGLVQAAKDGFDVKDYATYLFGKMQQDAKPGALTGEARAAFKKAKAAKTKVPLPAYEGVFSKDALAAAPPVKEVEAEPAIEEPKRDLAREDRARQAAKEDKARREGVKTRPSPMEKPKPETVTKVEPAKPMPKPAPVVVAQKEQKEETLSPKMDELWPGLDRASRSYLGTPYVWGGTNHNGIDCSGLTQNTYGENKVKIPRVSRDQWKTGEATTALKRGDLVFFNTMGVGVSHVGMVVDPKGPKFIHASSSKGVSVADMSARYYNQRYLGARRVVP